MTSPVEEQLAVDGASKPPTFSHFCVYNPALGGEDTVEKQLLHTHGSADFVKLIGLAQGIAELAYASGDEPARWFKTIDYLVVVCKLKQSEGGNWREGVWFAGQCQPDVDVPPLTIYRFVQVTYQHHCLLNAENDRFWLSFSENLTSQTQWPPLTELLAPDCIRMAPGKLNPEISRRIVQCTLKSNAKALMIASDGCVVFTHGLDHETQRELQRWIFRTSNCTGASEPETWYTSLTQFAPSAVTALGKQISAPLDWWRTPTETGSFEGVIVENVEIYGGEPMYATLIRQGMFVYCLVFETKCEISQALSTLEPLVKLLEGFSFAFSPPVRFQYLVNNGTEITSTFPERVEPELMRTLQFSDYKPQVIRQGSTWIYSTQLCDGKVHAVFGKKNAAQAPSLLGALHSDVQQWIDDYERVYS